jgi:hypothetical protein
LCPCDLFFNCHDMLELEETQRELEAIKSRLQITIEALSGATARGEEYFDRLTEKEKELKEQKTKYNELLVFAFI